MTKKERDKIKSLLKQWHKKRQGFSYVYKRGSSNIVKAVTSSVTRQTLKACINELEELFF